MKTVFGAVSFSCWALLLMALISSLTVGAHGADVAASSNKDHYYMDSSSVVERNLAPLPPAPYGEVMSILPNNNGTSNMNTQTFSAEAWSMDSDYNAVPITAIQIFYTLPGQTKAKAAKLKLGADGVWSVQITKLPVGQISWYLVATNSLKQTVTSTEPYSYNIVPGPPAGAGINCANPIVLDLIDAPGGSTDDRYSYLFSLKNAVKTCQFGCGGDFCASGGWTPGFWFKVNHNGFGPEVYFDMYVRVTKGPGVASITRFQAGDDTCNSLSLCESKTQPEEDCNDNIFDSTGSPYTCLQFPDGPGWDGPPARSGYDQNHYFFVHAYNADKNTQLTVTANLWF